MHSTCVRPFRTAFSDAWGSTALGTWLNHHTIFMTLKTAGCRTARPVVWEGMRCKPHPLPDPARIWSSPRSFKGAKSQQLAAACSLLHRQPVRRVALFLERLFRAARRQAERTDGRSAHFRRSRLRLQRGGGRQSRRHDFGRLGERPLRSPRRADGGRSSDRGGPDALLHGRLHRDARRLLRALLRLRRGPHIREHVVFLVLLPSNLAISEKFLCANAL